jgi:hypothetical protein
VRLIPLLTPMLALAACSDYTVKTTNSDLLGSTEEGVPDIVVDPVQIDFGSVLVGSGITDVRTVTITNVGDAALEISNLTLANIELFEVYELSTIGAVLVPPDGSTTFTVAYTPLTAAPANTDVLISSNDPDSPETPVELIAEGLAPVIEVSPENYDFGTMYIGCDLASTVTITNSGNADLIVTDFDYVSASDDLDFDDNETNVVDSVELGNGPLPWTIAPLSSLDVYVNYAPVDDYADEGFLTVDSNDPFRPQAQAYQTGNGVLYGENLDIFEQPIRGSSDIVFIIDNSCSMAEEQANLQDNFAYFAAGLVEYDLDYQIGVITTDSPTFRGEVITQDTDDIEAEFISQTSVGTGGSGNEMPSEMAYQSSSGGDISDFVRDDAILSMIFVSDEPDSSPSAWADYLDAFQSLKNDSDDYIAHAISGDWPTGCGTASATNNVYELTVATGGLYLSVCATEWASHLEALVEGSVADLSSFELTQWPVPATIVVRVDGITTTTGWEYNEADNSVDFDETHVPEGGSTIEVEYALFGDCEG